MKMFGRDGVGIFPAPSVIEKQVCRQYRVRPIGQLPDVHEHYYAISTQRKLKHPAAVAISRAAREELFA
jgi:LysR family transcriptional activator of nhaA